MIHVAITSINRAPEATLAQHAARRLRSVPAPLLRSVWYWNPGVRRMDPSRPDMVFDQGVGRDEWSELVAAGSAGGFGGERTAWSAYIGSREMPAVLGGRRAVVRAFEGAECLAFDYSASPDMEATEIPDLIRWGTVFRPRVGIEANGRRAWIAALLSEAGSAVDVITTPQLWLVAEDQAARQRNDRFTVEDVQSLGGRPLVYVGKWPEHIDREDDGAGAAFAAWKLAEAEAWARRGLDVIVRLEQMAAAQVDRLAALQAAAIDAAG